jgi:predicted membrane protein
MKQNTARLLVGMIIILAGLSLILKASGIEFNLFFTGWWAALMVVFAVLSILRGNVGPGNFALLIAGMWLLADQRGWIPQSLNTAYVLGAAIIGFGLLFLFGSKKEPKESDRPRRDHYQQKRTTPRSHNSEESPSYTAIFSGQDIRTKATSFTGASLFALFGGLTIDARDALITHDCIIDATALFGGIEIRLPDDVRVQVQATPLFGGVDDKTRAPMNPNAPIVTVRCLAAFGGVDIL